MTKLNLIALIMAAGSTVAIADVLIKKIADTQTSLIQGLFHPLIIPIILLYLTQIIIFIYIFIHDWELGIIGIMQISIYALIVVVSGILFFDEAYTITHGIGAALALIGITLLSL